MEISCVLVVDDSESDQFISKLMIESYDPNIVVLSAYDGQEALEMLASDECRPDLIFLDINMPRMNGHEFLEEYNKKSNKQAVVVMLTTSEQEVDRERAMAYKCVKTYLIKPLDESQLEAICKG
ncbi:MAG: CheY-like chemotaxis protein [Candidatus Azotimanducaceae bacterium]|jgi:CheY-like chemotaxis protein